MNCPSCGAPLRLEGDQEGLLCEYCRSLYLPEKNDDGVRLLGEAPESCPICAVKLTDAILERERIRYCTRCRGMLLTMSTFLTLIEEIKAGRIAHVVPHEPDHKELDRRIDCPQCHHRMDTHFYCGPGNVIIDDCSRCELNWLDHGELMRIATAPDRAYDENYGAKRDQEP